VTDADRFRLLFGPYRAPRFRYGRRVLCEERGEVIIVGLSDGPGIGPSASAVGGSARKRAAG
jgi:hypothetical protein